MREILSNIARRKVRSGLTVIGIVIGIFAVTVLGSMTEYFNGLIGNAENQARSSINVTPKGGVRSVLSEADMRRVERVPGVKAVVPLTASVLDNLSAVNFGPPNSVLGIPPELIQYRFTAQDLSRGRLLERGDTYQAVIGSNIVKKKKVDLGGTITWREHDFTIVGVLKETQTTPDGLVIIPLDIEQKVLKRPGLISQLSVIPENSDPAFADTLAQSIQDAVDNVQVQTVKQQLDSVKQGLGIFNAILLSSSVLAVVIGGLAVINTMIMSVSERTHEIGLKKAIGASAWNIVSEFVLEAAVIGFIGGVIGVALGAGLANFLNTTVSPSLGAADIFKVTDRLIVTTLGFAVVLGTLAGLYPAWSAARLDPVEALRTE